MAKILDLPVLERPREKALHYGLNSLSDIELLALIIGSGTKEHSALDISYEMFNEYRSFKNMCSRPYQEFKKIKGLGQISSLKICAALEMAKRYLMSNDKDELKEVNIEEIINKYALLFMNDDQENVVLILLNKKKQIIREINLYRGTNNKVNCSLREIEKELLLYSARYFYLIHNHPSGNIEPSENDLLFTGILEMECEKINIELLDHIIIGKNQYCMMIDKKINK